jgi:hypothetical protein
MRSAWSNWVADFRAASRPSGVDGRAGGRGTEGLPGHLAGESMVLQVEKSRGALDVCKDFGAGHLLPLEHLTRAQRPTAQPEWGSDGEHLYNFGQLEEDLSYLAPEITSHDGRRFHAYLTGQRVTDTRLMDERDVRDGQIWVLQGKTNAKRWIEITGELKVLIDRIMSRKSERKVRSTRLIVTENGTPMSVAMLRGRFDLAREAAGVAKSEFQMRDLRAKAGTDKAESSGDIMQARDQLGHTTVVMTEQYIRNRIGKKVSPTK